MSTDASLGGQEDEVTPEVAVGTDVSEAELSDFVTVQSVMSRRNFMAALGALGLKAVMPEEANADEPILTARNSPKSSAGRREERDIDALMAENPLLRDKNAVEAYFSGIDGRRENESYEEYRSRLERFTRVWDEYTPSLVNNTGPEEPTKFMLFRSSKPVTITRGGKKVKANMYVGIGTRDGLFGHKSGGLVYAKTLGYAQSPEQVKKINDNFVYGVVSRLK